MDFDQRLKKAMERGQRRGDVAAQAARAKAERAKAKKQRDKSRSKLLQRDRRGQPKAKHLIEHLLSRIEASRE